MGAHFLCCLPIRLGAFLITLGTTLSSAAAAGLLWYVISKYWDVLDTGALKSSVIILAVAQSLTALFGLGAFWGVMRKKLGLIKAFISIYAWQIGVNLGLNILTIVLLYKRSPEDWDKHCEKLFTDADVQKTCKDQIHSSKAGTIASAVVSLLFQCYCLWIVSQYAKKLEKQQHKNATMALGGPSYSRAAKNPQEADAFVAPKTDYAYTDGHNSFGHDASRRV